MSIPENLHSAPCKKKDKQKKEKENSNLIIVSVINHQICHIINRYIPVVVSRVKMTSKIAGTSVNMERETKRKYKLSV